MAKHGNTFYLQLTRELFTDKYKELSVNAKWLFVVLNELEQRFTGEKSDFFYRSNKDLCIDTGLSLSTLKRAKKELVATDLIHTWQTHFIVDKKEDKLSEKHFTAYRVKK